MSSPAIIAAKERIHELRAKQRWHSLQEFRKALEIRQHIDEQARIEVEIMGWEVHLESLKAGMTMQVSDSLWQKIKGVIS